MGKTFFMGKTFGKVFPIPFSKPFDVFYGYGFEEGVLDFYKSWMWGVEDVAPYKNAANRRM